MRFELTGYALNVEAGEDIRIIPSVSGSSGPADLPQEHDYWMFDSHDLYDQHYDLGGCWLGTEPVGDPARVVETCRWRDAALHQAMPWKDYMAGWPDLMQPVPSELVS